MQGWEGDAHDAHALQWHWIPHMLTNSRMHMHDMRAPGCAVKLEACVSLMQLSAAVIYLS